MIIIGSMKTTINELKIYSLPESTTPRFLFRVGLAFAILLTTVQAGVTLFVRNESSITIITDTLTVVSSMAAVLGMAYGVRWSYRVDRRIDPHGAIINWALGDILWGYYELVLGEVPFPSIADIFYLSAYLFFFIGI